MGADVDGGAGDGDVVQGVAAGEMSNRSMLTVPVRGPVKARLTSLPSAPVVGSKAKMLLRAIAVVGAAAVATLVNLPPAIILLPTWTMASTLPSSTCGVQSAGLLDTNAACGVFTAAPGYATRPIRTAAHRSANRTRRPMSGRFPLCTCSGCANAACRPIASLVR